MIDRFAVRTTDEGFGVWDAAVNGWHSRRDLDESTATALADGMNARATVQDTGSRPARRVNPPRRVLIMIDGKWWPGRLDWWVRETDGWYGRATLEGGGPSSWYPASTLRPAPE